MEAIKSKFGIIIALLLCVTVIGTCTFLEHPTDTSPHSNQDTTFIHEWKMEKLALQKQYESKIADLQSSKDSLQRITIEKKKALNVYRAKAQSLQMQLTVALHKADSIPLVADTIIPITEQYFATEAARDSSCNETIKSLEQIVANRDSSIYLYRQSETNLRELQKEQKMREQQLTDQLNTAYKAQRKKVFENKFLACGLVFITGFTTTLLITQKLK